LLEDCGIRHSVLPFDVENATEAAQMKAVKFLVGLQINRVNATND